jgi:hypothetical protein
MRVVKKVCLTFSVAFLLLVGQLPELFSLIDDTSNDFVEELFSAASENRESTLAKTILQHGPVLDDEPNRIVRVERSIQSAPFSAQPLFRLLSVQRK